MTLRDLHIFNMASRQKKSNVSLDEVLNEIWADDDSHSEPDNSSSDDECESVCESIESGQNIENFADIDDVYQLGTNVAEEQNLSTNSTTDEGNQEQRSGRKRRKSDHVQSKRKSKPTKVVWKEVKDHIPDPPTFTAQPGLQVPLGENPKAIDFFQLFLDDDLIDLLVEQTNIYANQYLQQHQEDLRPRSRAKQWKDTNREEIITFLALTLLMGILKKPEYQMYWAKDPLLHTPFFSATMTREKYLILLQFLHFADNSQYDPDDENRNRLYKIRPLVDYLVTKFKSIYIPKQQVSIDEELVLWKGRLQFRQYIPAKRARFGVKIYNLCDSSTAYLWNSKIYAGKGSDEIPDDVPKTIGKSGSVVIEMMESLLGKGYHVYLDNWYTSISLFRYLREKETGACGTLRKNRANELPPHFHQKGLKRGESKAFSHEKLLAINYQDKKSVYMLTTLQDNSHVGTGKRDRHGVEKVKPKAIHQYNKFMGGVDRNDMLLGFYTSCRKSLKWYKKIAIHYIELALLNAFVLMKESDPKCRLLRFRLDIIRSLLNGVQVRINQAIQVPNRLEGRHFPAEIPPTEGKQRPTRKCLVCAAQKHRKETRYICKTCIKPLCVVPCFETYHTHENYT
jgi:hypothetical protein